jgi:hypothetical protein
VLDRMEAVPGMIPVPAAYQKAWETAPNLRWFRDWPDEIQVMRREVAVALAKMKELRDEAAKLKDENWGSPLDRRKLREKFSTKERDFKYREGNFQNIPDSQVTYNDVAEFEPVHEQWQLWLRDRRDPLVNLDEFNKAAGKD